MAKTKQMSLNEQYDIFGDLTEKYPNTRQTKGNEKGVVGALIFKRSLTGDLERFRKKDSATIDLLIGLNMAGNLKEAEKLLEKLEGKVICMGVKEGFDYKEEYPTSGYFFLFKRVDHQKYRDYIFRSWEGKAKDKPYK